MSRFRVFLGLAVLLAASAPAVTGEEGLSVHRSLPKDPLLVMALSTDELAGKIEAASAWLASAEDGRDVANVIEGLERQLGISLDADLLSRLGPGAALSVDLPPLDVVVAAIRIQSMEGWATVLAGSGLVAEVRDEEHLSRDLHRIFEVLSGSPPENAAVTTVRFPISGPADPTDATASRVFLEVHYAIRDGRLALGFDPEWVVSRLEERPPGESLTDGKDFSKVFAQLDRQPRSLTYINLPKLGRLVEDSEIVAAVIESSPDVRRFLGPFLDSDVMSVGLGSTSIAVNGGVRTTHFGPHWMSGTASSSSLLAAMAIPSLLVAVDRGKARETLEDIQSIASACEEFSGDTRSYPGPTDGWVPVGKMSAFLEPIYIGEMPRTDAWDNPILYWSDGVSYRILSTGVDGRMDRDWMDVTEPTLSSDEVGDILVTDGRILVLPRELSE